MISLKAFVCLVVCSSIVCNASHGYRQTYRRPSYYPQQVKRCGLTKDQILAPTDDASAQQLGVKLPDTSCLLTWSQFDMNIAGTDCVAAYSIDDDKDPMSTHKYMSIWSMEGKHIRQKTMCVIFESGTNDLYTNKCTMTSELMSKASTKHAIMQPSDMSSPRRDYIFSCDPSRYIIYFTCHVAPVHNRCPKSSIHLMMKDQRAMDPAGDKQRLGFLYLNDIPWLKIETTLKKCIDQLFVDDIDPQIKWTWDGKSCPHPDSMAAMNMT